MKSDIFYTRFLQELFVDVASSVRAGHGLGYRRREHIRIVRMERVLLEQQLHRLLGYGKPFGWDASSSGRRPSVPHAAPLLTCSPISCAALRPDRSTAEPKLSPAQAAGPQVLVHLLYPQAGQLFQRDIADVGAQVFSRKLVY